LKKGQEIELSIESLAFGAKGVAKTDNFVVFVNGALPGETVLAKIRKKQKNHAEAQLVKVLQKSPFYVEPVCSHFGECGGCSIQHLDYEKQLEYKTDQVGDVLRKLGGLSGFELLPTIPSPNIFNYRNKMEFSFSRDRWITQQEISSGETIERSFCFLGMHAKGFFEKVVDLQECHLVNPIASEILKEVRAIAKESELEVYTTKDHTGFWRFLVIRSCQNTNDLMVNIVTHSYNEEIAHLLKERLISKFPSITSLLYSTTTNKANVAFSEEEHLLAGNRTIFEKLGDYKFEISANSFFQTNSKQAEQLYDVVKEYADFDGSENVYDLYCGAGTISLYISKYANKVVGFEAIDSAVKDARRNAELNKVKNCQFVRGDLRDQLTDIKMATRLYGRPDVMIIDPPRAGMHPKTVKTILRLKPEKIVHVSCNPATLARDLKELCAEFYKLVKVQPVDMFPHTAHVEVVALLVKA
jgi:23S rRNA (uracil1939-C5)-methyltransferase